MGMKLPPDFVFPEGTRMLGINLAGLTPAILPSRPSLLADITLTEPAPEVVPSKYRNRPTRYHGRLYASLAEMRRAAALDASFVELGGDVIEWTPQPLVYLAGLWYRPDFRVMTTTGSHYEDVKGATTQRFRDIVRLWELHGRLDLHVLYKNQTEIIRPERKTA